MEDDLEVSVGTEGFDIAGASAELSESLFGSSGDDNSADDGPSLEGGESSDGGDTATDIPAAKDDAQAAPVADSTEPAAAEVLPAPKTWRPEAAAKWAALPPEVQQEVLKREQDIFKASKPTRPMPLSGGLSIRSSPPTSRCWKLQASTPYSKSKG